MATLKPSIANVQPPRCKQPMGKQKGKESGKATTSNLNQPRTRSQAAQVTRQATLPAGSTRSKKGASNRFQRMENKVQRALAVMDRETGQLLNYRQLIRNPKYKKDWNISTANKFGRLAQGVGAGSKELIQSSSYTSAKYHEYGSNMSHTGNLSALNVPKRKRKIVPDSRLVAIE
jgi:hypothetical protein